MERDVTDAATKSRVTSADVARRANVSRATVSYVLNDKPGHGIPTATQEAVLRAARELGYRPNLAARQLAGGAGSILVLIPAIRTSDQLTALASHLTQELAARDLLMSVAFDVEHAPALADIARATGASTVAVMRSLTQEEQSELDALGATVVTGGGGFSQVNETVGERQIEHLWEYGHRRIAYASTGEPGLDSFVAMRRRGVVAAAAQRGVDVSAESFAPDGSDAASIVLRWREEGITGVAAYNDDVAMRVLHGIRSAGLRCPGDLAVIGVDDIPSAQVSDPPLSTVKLSPEHFARVLASDLLAALPRAGRNASPAVDASAPSDALQVIARESTG